MAAVVTYAYPVAGTTPPTLAQTSNQVNATVAWADADTTATITHNFTLAVASIAELRPYVAINLAASSTGTLGATVTITKTNSNSITLTKSTAAGSGGTLDVAILRPQSVAR